MGNTGVASQRARPGETRAGSENLPEYVLTVRWQHVQGHGGDAILNREVNLLARWVTYVPTTSMDGDSATMSHKLTN